MTDFCSGVHPKYVKTSQELQLWEPIPERVLECALHICVRKGRRENSVIEHLWNTFQGGEQVEVCVCIWQYQWCL